MNYLELLPNELISMIYDDLMPLVHLAYLVDLIRFSMISRTIYASMPLDIKYRLQVYKRHKLVVDEIALIKYFTCKSKYGPCCGVRIIKTDVCICMEFDQYHKIYNTNRQTSIPASDLYCTTIGFHRGRNRRYRYINNKSEYIRIQSAISGYFCSYEWSLLMEKIRKYSGRNII